MNKKTVISLLTTVALTSLTAVHAEETSKQGWIKENDFWYYLKSDGKIRETEVKKAKRQFGNSPQTQQAEKKL
ncbi:hypothetical protein [Granulicatella elegans]|uniref:hypothetical protein n=1 Tax=Granulicatella elegans TaxID=137732 RepID=UPI001D13784B|nr:hypothetical protein [Granulicatella elegans]UEA31867.1 hypothetical protein LK443_02640 [Granulicatella elegans]